MEVRRGQIPRGHRRDLGNRLARIPVQHTWGTDKTELHNALYHWAFNSAQRRRGRPKAFADTIAWTERNSLPIGAASEPAVIRRALELLACKQDGSPCAASTYRRKRAVFHNALGYAVKLGHLPTNPLTNLKRTAPRVPESVDPRVLVDQRRAQALLEAVGSQKNHGPQLTAFFAWIYYAAIRPSEVVALRVDNVLMPADRKEWGEFRINRSAPAAGTSWTDSGQRRETRQLKHRAVGEVRVVPCHPRLVEILRDHLQRFGTAPDGRLFRGARGGQLSEGVYGRIWQDARRAALTSGEAASSLAARPYDLRHACVTNWPMQAPTRPRLPRGPGTASTSCSASTYAA
jgi:integrase